MALVRRAGRVLGAFSFLDRFFEGFLVFEGVEPMGGRGLEADGERGISRTMNDEKLVAVLLETSLSEADWILRWSGMIGGLVTHSKLL